MAITPAFFRGGVVMCDRCQPPGGSRESKMLVASEGVKTVSTAEYQSVRVSTGTEDHS